MAVMMGSPLLHGNDSSGHDGTARSPTLAAFAAVRTGVAFTKPWSRLSPSVFPPP